MQNNILKDFNKELNILVMGAGRMGKVHLRALLESKEKILKPQGYKVNISVADKNASALENINTDVTKFLSTEEALESGKDFDIAVMAYNDDQHLEAFKSLFKKQPNIKAIFSEKPLTETLSEAEELKPWLEDKYLSINTVINFSPVFDKLASIKEEFGELYGELKPFGFEAVWGKNRISDTRPSIGVQSESVHALSVVSDMFGQDELILQEGQGAKGYLSTGAQDVPHEMKASFKSKSTGLKINTHLSYTFDKQERRVTAYFNTEDFLSILAAEMDFDIRDESGIYDTLKIYEINRFTGVARLQEEKKLNEVYTSDKSGVLNNDKVTAFINLSLQDYLNKNSATPELIKNKLGNIDRAMSVQKIIEQIRPEAGHIEYKKKDADPENLITPKYKTIAESNSEEKMERQNN